MKGEAKMSATISEIDKTLSFGEEFPDGRLCEKGNYRPFKLREALSLSEKLGRELTGEELDAFYY